MAFDTLYPATAAQQVSIYPYQQLSSVYGNELLYGLIDPGIYQSSISISNGSDNTYFRISINNGSTFVFMRQHTNPENALLTDTVIGKIVITSPNYIDVKKSDLWHDIGSYSSTTKLYIVADWNYSISTSGNKYVSFSIETDSSIGNILALNNTANHKLIVATILNHQKYVADTTAIWPATTYTGFSLTNYHIAYDNQTNRNALKRMFATNDKFNVDFAASGRSVTVNPGNAFIADSLLSVTTQQTIAPAVGITTYVSSKANNTLVNITGSEASYYQIDFLRVKYDDNTRTQTIGWESFLQLKTTLDNGLSTLDFTTYTMTQADLIAHVRQASYPIAGDGLTLMIAVRLRSSIPTTDGATNILWPESCIMLKDNSIITAPNADYHNRMKVPVWTAGALGY